MSHRQVVAKTRCIGQTCDFRCCASSCAGTGVPFGRDQWTAPAAAIHASSREGPPAMLWWQRCAGAPKMECPHAPACAGITRSPGSQRQSPLGHPSHIEGRIEQ